jgi:hypothetical protein
MEFGDPIPFFEALNFARRKEVLPTDLSSADLRQLSGDLRRRSIFAARVSQADHLQSLGSLVEKLAGGLSEPVAGRAEGAEPSSRMLSIPEAKAQLAEYLDGIGYEPNADEEGGIKDLRSDSRLQLQVETNLLDTLGFGRWKATQDPVALDVNPAWELVRTINSRVPRDWEERWDAARSDSSEEGSTPASSGRMVALKNHPIWQALGDGAGGYEDTLGNPWPPFAFNSGMNVVDVPRDEAIELGLLGEDTIVPPDDRALNDGVEVDAAGRYDDLLMRELAQNPDLQLREGVLSIA